MNLLRKLPLKNLTGRPGRMIAMVLFAALFAFAVFGGTLMISGLQRGLETTTAKLGADIVVVPGKAKSQFNVNSILLQGQPGYFYMDSALVDKIAACEGVQQVSPQLYLASTTASCCSSSLQIIGFDPETDFTIQPWIGQLFDGKTDIGYMDVIVGSDVSIAESRILRFYGEECHIIGQFARTGSTLDACVYANFDTIRTLIAASQAVGLNQFGKFDPNNVVSTVLVKVEDGASIDHVEYVINKSVRHIKAVGAKELVSGVADSLRSLSGMIGLFIGVIWVLCVLVMLVVFTMVINERKREFAVLRVMGMSRGRLARLVVSEAMIVNLLGSLIGIALAMLVFFPFNAAIGAALGLPLLIPGLGRILLLVAGTLAVSALVGALISTLSARRISRIDTSLILREGD